MLISDKQQAANQKNAQRSTGPKTPEGKQAVRYNALTYGLRTRATVLPDEDVGDYYRLWNELQAEWQPQTRTELCYLETMVTCQWLLVRIAASEQRIYMRMPFDEQQFKMLGYVAKQRAQLERSFRTAIDDLKQSQKERRQQHALSREAQPAKPAQAVQAPPPPPAYVMSEGAEAHPVLCCPVTPDTR